MKCDSYFQMADQYSELLGPFLLNKTIICFNVSLLPKWVAETDSHYIGTSNNRKQYELHQAVVPCSGQMESEPMHIGLVYFWNLAFTLMIIMAIVGNCAVLWIVICEYLTDNA